MLAVATCDETAASALRRLCEVRVAEWAPCVRQAAERGEVPADSDPFEVVRAVCAPLYYELLTGGGPPDEAAADRAAEAACVAARAGVYGTGGYRASTGRA